MGGGREGWQRRRIAEGDAAARPSLARHPVADGVHEPVDEAGVGRGSLERARLDEVDPEAVRRDREPRDGEDRPRVLDRSGAAPREIEDERHRQEH